MIPPDPPVEGSLSATTVLAGKGALRRAKNRAPLPAARLCGVAASATGGSGGITRRRRAMSAYRPTTLKQTEPNDSSDFAELDKHNC